MNAGRENGMVCSGPHRLCAGPGKRGRVDANRHEEVPDSPFGPDWRLIPGTGPA